MKNLIIVFIILSSQLLASDKVYEEVIRYTDLNFNKNLSLHLGKTNMGYFLEDEAYGVGLIYQDDSDMPIEFGVGYVQPSSKFIDRIEEERKQINKTAEDGVLFFINYNF